MDNVRSGLRSGLVMAIVTIFIVLLGVTNLTGTIVSEWFNLPSHRWGAWILLLVIALWGGTRAVKKVQCGSWIGAVIAGILAGVSHGVLSAAFTGAASALINAGVDMRKILAQISSEAIGLLTFGLPPATAALVMTIAITAAGLVGALVAYASVSYGWREGRAKQWQALRERISSSPTVRQITQFEYLKYILYGIGLAILLGSPFVLGQYRNYTLGTVGIYVILGLGLNIVVGMTGLLHLGYAAFFAIGAYTVAILTAPQFGIGWSFWIALPIGVVLTTLTGVLLSIPVLRMRGDYLAIVTLGFGEIIRILAKSDALTNFTGGPKGVRDVAGPTLLGTSVNSEFHFMYFIILGIVLAIFVTSRLQNSRLGRALMAMREDEDVAQAVGIYTLKYKVLSFAIGAAFAGLGGVIFASRNKFTGPEDYTLLVSVNVLSLVIIGGMNSIPGVVLGALVLKGLPEMLRELDDYRMLAFGVLLIAMMILRPEGLWPSQRRRIELHGEAPDKVSAGRATGD